MARKPDQFGINMRRFCAEHEAWVETKLAENGCTRALLELHLEKLRWLQHERLVHLLVLLLTSLAELFTVLLTLTHPELGAGPALVMLVLAVLLGFYFVHYFFLENTTQHWYRIAERLMHELYAAGCEE